MAQNIHMRKMCIYIYILWILDSRLSLVGYQLWLSAVATSKLLTTSKLLKQRYNKLLEPKGRRNLITCIYGYSPFENTSL